MQNKFNITDFVNYKASGRKITMVTAYDYHSAQILAESQIDTILVGDSLGMVIQGKQNTLSVTLEDILYHTQAVRRGAPNTFIIADMPYLSYHLDVNTSIQNAGLLISQGGADAVKLEINHPSAIEHIQGLIAAQIPVIAHVGLTPQSVNVFGGFKLQGKTLAQVEHLHQLAIAAEAAGASACVIECVPTTVARQLTQDLGIATIGIGAGIACDGQVLVYNDLLGFSVKSPKFVKQYLNGRELLSQAITSFSEEVRNGIFPTAQQSFSGK